MTIETEFTQIDRQIDELQEKLESCRQAMALSRAAIVVSLVTLGLVSTFAGNWRTPAVVFSAVAALIGGIVWLGATRTSRDELVERLAALDLSKNRLIDQVATRNGWKDLTPTIH